MSKRNGTPVIGYDGGQLLTWMFSASARGGMKNSTHELGCGVRGTHDLESKKRMGIKFVTTDMRSAT